MPPVSDSDFFTGSEAVLSPVFPADTDAFTGDDENNMAEFITMWLPGGIGGPFNLFGAAPVPSPLRLLYRSLAQVSRNQATIQSDGTGVVSWAPLPVILDPFLPGNPGQLLLRLDLQFNRPGKDIPMPLVAGRAPDRVGLAIFDCLADAAGLPLIQPGDRLTMLAGPVFGTFEIRVIPDVAQDFLGSHHIEVQVIEVAQSLVAGSMTPFPAVGAT